MIAILKRELRAYFWSPIGYIFVGFFLLLAGFFFALSNLLYGYSNFIAVFGNMNVVLLILVPILTMRLLSEERKTKTDQILLTSPVSITGVIVGKYLAALSVLLIALLITGIYPIILSLFCKPPVGEILGAYIGFFLMGASFISMGLFVSSLTESQVTAAVASFGTLLLLWIIDWVVPSIQNATIAKAVEWFSILKRFQDFTMGILSLEHVVFYISFTVVFIFLTIRVLEKRRWS